MNVYRSKKDRKDYINEIDYIVEMVKSTTNLKIINGVGKIFLAL